jgi:hypothetical protein
MDEHHMDEHRQLQRARKAARACRRAAEQLVEFADRLSWVIGPAEMAEYDTLVAREAAALSERVETFAALGLVVASLDDEVQEHP